MLKRKHCLPCLPFCQQGKVTAVLAARGQLIQLGRDYPLYPIPATTSTTTTTAANTTITLRQQQQLKLLLKTATTAAATATTTTATC